MRAKQKRRPAPHLPAPEAIDGGTWTIQTSPVPRIAGVDLSEASGGTMIVPTGGSERERCVRLHEMTHARITPRGPDRPPSDLPEAVVQHVEDRRVHAHLRGWGFDLSGMDGLLDAAELAPEAIEKMPRCVRASLVAATYDTGEAARTHAAVAAVDEIAAAVGLTAAQGMYAGDDYGRTLDVAAEIVATLGRPDAERDEQEADAIVRNGIDADALDRRADEIEHGGGKGSTGSEDRRGTLHVTTPPLTRTIVQGMRARSRSMAYTSGSRLRHPGRLYRDNRVFSYRRTAKGAGAVLLDCSGSMHYQPEEIEQLMRLYPAGIIAAYSGTDSGWDPVTRETSYDPIGELRVIARDGRRVARDEHLSTATPMGVFPGWGGNSIDSEALRWLNRQPGPRYWVSDLGVCGGPGHLLDCLALVRIGRVTILDRAGDLLDAEAVR